jgi:hypothetical protein
MIPKETPEKQDEKPTIENCILVAIESSADNYNKIETHILRKQRNPVSSSRLERALMSMILSGQIAVTNGRYWIRTGVAPTFCQGQQ